MGWLIFWVLRAFSWFAAAIGALELSFAGYMAATGSTDSTHSAPTIYVMLGVFFIAAGVGFYWLGRLARWVYAGE